VSGSVGSAHSTLLMSFFRSLLFILKNFFMYFVQLNNIYSVYSEYMHVAHVHVQ
jgi:hypothetical protein